MKEALDIAYSNFQQSKYQATIDTCSEILVADSNSIEALKLIAKSYLALRKIEKARSYLNKVLIIKPDDIEVIKDLGNTYQAAGNINTAKDFYKKAISINQNYAPALTNLGGIELSKGNKKKALSLLLKATQSDPNLAPSWGNLGNCYIQLGKVKEAEDSLRKSIDLNPNSVQALSNLGLVLNELGKNEEAELYINKSIDINPNSFKSHFNLAIILIKQKRLNEAETSLLKTIKLKSDFINAYLTLGVILKDLGRSKEAEILTHKAININPNCADAHLNLGNILNDLGKIREAEISIRKAIKLQPNLDIAHSSLGSILTNLGSLEEAEISIRRAIKLNPNCADAHLNLSTTLISMNKLEEAEISIQKLIELEQDSAKAYINQARIFKDKGKFKEAFYSYQVALEKEPENTDIIAELIRISTEFSLWRDAEKYSKLLSKIDISLQSFNPFKFCHIEDEPILYFQRAINYYNKNFKRESLKIDYIKKEKIHIGYFSADFHAHPVMYLISRILELHDFSKFEIFIYSFSTKEDNYTEKLKKSPFHFRSIYGKSDLDAVSIAKNDQLDIAIDLMGYTRNNRMNIFSYRVAPIQINYLGLEATTGSTEMDYLIADKITIPKEYSDFYSEKILYMPNCYMPFNNQRKISEKTFYRSDFGLPEDSFVLAAFHRIHKITPREILSWSNILKALPNAVIWINEPIEVSKQNFLKLFKDNGIDSNRIYFAQRMKSIEEHLSRHFCADLFIDTFNFNAHSTAMDSLWCELPIITLMGKSFIARIASSLLTNIGLNELIAHTQNEYEEIIIRLSKNPDLLNAIKVKLKEAKIKSKLFNSEQYTKDLENIYEKIISTL